MKADAVKYSIERTKKINKGAAYIWDSVKEINIKDDYTVEFKLSYAAPVDLIASCGYAGFIMSPKIAEQRVGWFSRKMKQVPAPISCREIRAGANVSKEALLC